MQLEPVIGLEVHIQLKTNRKMFCNCANISGDVEPNSAICPICLGYPGMLPVPNEQAIQFIHKAGAALNCELPVASKFDRKHYFYPDLPKAYQISQFDQPFCGEGALNGIGIERIHLEEDAAKNTHPAGANFTLVDYNRAGTPLMELVTKPDIKTPQQAKNFLQELRKIMRALNISDADMEKGQLRCDANISLRPVGDSKLYPKTEVKNLNSFKNVEKALLYEIERQTKLWEANKEPNELATRGFDASTGKTTEQRTKEAAADYRYFPEPDIPSFRFDEEYFAAIRAEMIELPQAKAERLQSMGISEQNAKLLAGSPNLADFFENTVSELEALEKLDLAKSAANITLRQVRDLKTSDINITPENFAELLVLLDSGKLNSNAVDQVLPEMQRTGGDPDAIIKNLGLEQVSDASGLDAIIQEVIAENPDVVEKIKAGKDSAIQALVGQVMAKSQGVANPKTALELLLSRLR